MSLLGFIAASTFLDINLCKTKSKSNPVTFLNCFIKMLINFSFPAKPFLVTAFSLSTNTAELFEIEENPSKSTVSCLFGLRVIAGHFVTAIHRETFLHMSRPLDDSDFYKEWLVNMRLYSLNTLFLVTAVMATKMCIDGFRK